MKQPALQTNKYEKNNRAVFNNDLRYGALQPEYA